MDSPSIENHKHHTAERILDAAECLFAELGFEATTMRMITRRANVNLAAVNYHFGHKQDLFQQVLRRRLSQLNQARIEALDVLEADEDSDALSAEKVLRAFFIPAVRMASDTQDGGAAFMRLLGRTYTFPDAGVAKFIAEEYGPVMQRYLIASSRVIPQLPRAELAWRLHFMAGAVTYAISGADALSLVQQEDSHVPEVLVERLICFFLGGLQAPLSWMDSTVS